MISNIMDKCLVILAMIFIGNPTFAQFNIQGSVQNVNNENLPYSKVYILKKTDSTLVQYTECNSNGIYKIEKLKDGEYILKATFLGYEDKYSLIKNINDKTIVVDFILNKEKVNNLKEVQITAKRKFIEYKGSSLLLNVENNIITSGTNIWELLGKSPGIETSDNNISLLGTSGVNVLINGKSTYLQGNQLANMLKGMSVDQISQLEIIKNPSAKYDVSQGTGIINIKLKKNISEGFNGNIAFTYGQGKFPKYNPTLNINYRIKKINFFANYAFQNIKDYREEPSFLDFKDISKPIYFDQKRHTILKKKSNSILVGINYQINDRNSLGFQFNGQSLRSKNNYNNSSYEYIDSSLNSTTKTESIISQPVNLQFYNLNYDAKFDETFNLSANIDYGIYNSQNSQYYDFQYYNPDFSLSNPNEYFRNYVPSKIAINAQSIDVSKKLENGLSLEAGFKNSNIKNNSELVYQKLNDAGSIVNIVSTNDFLYKEQVDAAYLTLQKEYKKLDLKLGLRAEISSILGRSTLQGNILDTNYFKLFPSLESTYKLNDNNQFDFSFTTSFERPNYNYISPLPVIRDPNSYSVGNAFLVPSYTNTLELTYTLKKKYRAALQIQAISNRIEQSVIQNYEDLTLENNIVNIDKCYYYRIYFVMPFSMAKWWKSNTVLNNYIIQYITPYLNGIYNNSKFVSYINSSNSFTFSNGLSAELLAYYRTPSLNGLYEVGTRFFVDIGVKKKFSDHFSIGFIISDLFHTNDWKWNIDYLNQHSGYKTITDSRVYKLNLSYSFGNQKVKSPKKVEKSISNEKERLK